MHYLETICKVSSVLIRVSSSYNIIYIIRKTSTLDLNTVSYDDILTNQGVSAQLYEEINDIHGVYEEVNNKSQNEKSYSFNQCPVYVPTQPHDQNEENYSLNQCPAYVPTQPRDQNEENYLLNQCPAYVPMQPRDQNEEEGSG